MGSSSGGFANPLSGLSGGGGGLNFGGLSGSGGLLGGGPDMGGIGGILGGAGGAAGGGLAQLGQGFGGGLSAANPFHPINYTSIGTPQAPGQVSAGHGWQSTEQTGPQASTLQGVGQGQTNAFRTGQLGLMSSLQSQANGTDNTAQKMLQQQTQQNVANQFAMANSARPGQHAMALRNSMNNAQQMNAQANVQGANLGLQQRMQAQQLLGNVAGQGYGQDVNVANANAGFQNQASLAGYQGRVSQANLNAQLAEQQNQLGMQAGQNNANNQLQYNGQIVAGQMDNNNMSSASQQYQRQQIGQFVNGLAGNFGQISSLFGGGAAGVNGSTGMGSNTMAGGGAANFMGPPVP